jgi:hypothetical protein
LEEHSPQWEIKNAVIEKIRYAGFEPQIFLEAGLVEKENWGTDRLYAILKKCDGAVILGQKKSALQGKHRGVPTEYNHFEGALASFLNLPVLVLHEKGIEPRGIFFNTTAHKHHEIPLTADKDWIKDNDYLNDTFNAWKDAVDKRHQVFVGYSGGAKEIATPVIKFLRECLNLKVKEYKSNFKPASDILEEIDVASLESQCAIFLFTKDDMILGKGSERGAAPRDNVIFEAGYFIKTLGYERVRIIKEKGTKMPTDLGGKTYLSFENREDLSGIFEGIEKFLSYSLYYDNTL